MSEGKKRAKAGPGQMLVNGTPVDIDIRSELTIQDVSDDMDRVAALMGFWGTVWAEAEAEKVDAEAFYRKWKADKTKEVMTKEPKLALPKIAAVIESDEMFSVLKKAIARSTKNVLISRTHYESFKTKASILQSKGRMLLSEYEATNIKTTQPTQQKTEDDKVQNMKQIFNNKE